jgi:hypothetical protein
MSKLTSFFNSGKFSIENERTLTKANSGHQNASFWQHRPKQTDNREYRRHSNFSANNIQPNE